MADMLSVSAYKFILAKSPPHGNRP